MGYTTDDPMGLYVCQNFGMLHKKNDLSTFSTAIPTKSELSPKLVC